MGLHAKTLKELTDINMITINIYVVLRKKQLCTYKIQT